MADPLKLTRVTNPQVRLARHTQHCNAGWLFEMAGEELQGCLHGWSGCAAV